MEKKSQVKWITDTAVFLVIGFVIGIILKNIAWVIFMMVLGIFSFLALGYVNKKRKNIFYDTKRKAWLTDIGIFITVFVIGSIVLKGFSWLALVAGGLAFALSSYQRILKKEE
ncbi:hypothetical protein MFLO_01860 [Listeria floridensis FSL S10-1187]|uniref:Uncharacterized protein n=1 Tax=Listeria floridensis FSL S10-1187 TaxID=1265817 RepID=A0ABP3B1V5_9LIST|nr:hypothetical protein [Listeria floridensis]EUJ33924.1 hypothetical protein MFLO_01860 [Listeria floridensis FSL S10-1187]